MGLSDLDLDLDLSGMARTPTSFLGTVGKMCTGSVPLRETWARLLAVRYRVRQ